MAAWLRASTTPETDFQDDSCGAQLYPGSIATPTPQTFGMASPPISRVGFGVDRQLADGRALRPAQIRQVGAGVVITGRQALVPRVHLPVSLAEPEPSGSASPSRRCQGCLPPAPASPETNCPQLQPGCCDKPAVMVSHLTRLHSASWRTDSLRQARIRLPRHRHRSRSRHLAPHMIARTAPPGTPVRVLRWAPLTRSRAVTASRR